MLNHIEQGKFRGQRVGVVMGGDSDEREVSLRTGKAFADALRERDYDVVEYDVPQDVGKLVRERPAAVILGLHGGSGENGMFQGFFEVLDIPYTGSGVMASALAMDKARAKAALRDANIPTPRGRFVPASEIDFESGATYLETYAFPVVAKVNDSGSSFGVYLCTDMEDFERALAAFEDVDTTSPSAGLLIEELIDGEEYTVGFFDHVCLGAIQVVPAEKFYDYSAKYEAKTTQYLPVEDEELRERLEVIGWAACRTIGCRGVARVDFMRRGSELFVLEINTIPGMTETSLVPKMAARMGYEFEDFTELMLSSATCES